MNETVADYSRASKAVWSKFKTKYLIHDPQIEPMVTMVITENWVEFTARYVVDFRARRVTRDQIGRAMMRSVKDSGGKVRFASKTTEISLVDAHGQTTTSY